MSGDSCTPLGLLLEHDRWATRRLLALCRDFSQGEFEKRFDMGLGSLLNTLTHIIGAMRRWTNRIGGEALQPSVEGTSRSAAQMIEMHDAAAKAFGDLAQSLLADGAFNEEMTIELPHDTLGMQRYTFTRGAAIIHVLTHGTHHRAQCIWMLRRLRPGIELPDFDVIESQIMPGDETND